MGRDDDLNKQPIEHHRFFVWSGRLLEWMQAELDTRTWLAADHETIADVAMYSYLRVANEGDIDLSPYPAVNRWMTDVEDLDGFIPMARSV